MPTLNPGGKVSAYCDCLSTCVQHLQLQQSERPHHSSCRATTAQAIRCVRYILLARQQNPRARATRWIALSGAGGGGEGEGAHLLLSSFTCSFALISALKLAPLHNTSPSFGLLIIKSLPSVYITAPCALARTAVASEATPTSKKTRHIWKGTYTHPEGLVWPVWVRDR